MSDDGERREPELEATEEARRRAEAETKSRTEEELRERSINSKHRPMPGTEGLLVHRDQIKRIRTLTTKAEGDRRRQAEASLEALVDT